MKSTNKCLIFLSLIIISSLIFSSCEEAEPNDSYSFEVVSSYGGFSGYCKVDGESAEEFTSLPMGTSAIYHRYQKILKSPESVLVSVTGSSSATAVSIYVYADSKLVDQVTVSQNDVNVKVTATLSYSFNSTDNDN